MTWHDYLAGLPPEERALVYVKDRKTSKGYRAHYYRWKISQNPDYYKTATAHAPEYFREFRKRHRERLRALAKRPEAKAKNAAKVARWRAANPERNRAIGRKAAKQPNARIKKAIRNRLNQHLRGIRPGKTTTQIVGLTAAQLRTYLESLWQPGMTWDNYGWGPGKWNIDHKIPLASAKGDLETLLRLQHYTNLQPLWHEDNMRKSDSLDWDLTKPPNAATMGVS